jgi:hypothetical protein
MRLAIIIDNTNNDALLRFTQTKLFFDAKNQFITNFVEDCVVVDSLDQALAIAKDIETSFIIKTGYFLTTTFRIRHKDFVGTMIVEDNDDSVIYFDPDTIISFYKRSHYPAKSKQLYIIENMLKTISNSKKMIYFDNTEEFIPEEVYNVDHLYGLASGWKTVRVAKHIGLNKLKSITVYDFNETQLDYARTLHSCSELPSEIKQVQRSYGIYKIPEDLINFWKEWHNYPVNFQAIDLFDIPKFKSNSLVWISNVFKYEPTLFTYGWETCKKSKKSLINKNYDCIIKET